MTLISENIRLTSWNKNMNILVHYYEIQRALQRVLIILKCKNEKLVQFRS